MLTLIVVPGALLKTDMLTLIVVPGALLKTDMLTLIVVPGALLKVVTGPKSFLLQPRLKHILL